MNFDNRSALGENESIVVDVSGLGNNGSASGGLRVNTTDCKYGTCFTFDGKDDYVNVSSSPSVNIAGNMTVFGWFKANSDYTTQQVLVANSQGNGAASNYVLVFGYTDNKVELWNEDSLEGFVSSARSISDDTWHHYAATRSGTTGSWNVTLYIDGLFDNSSISTRNPDGGTYQTSIGRFGAYPGYYLNGSIDEVMIFNRSLSSSEIYQLYATNLYKFNSTQWYLTVNQSKNTMSALDV